MVGFVTDGGLAHNVAAWLAYASPPLYVQCGTGSGQASSANDLAAAVQARDMATSTQETTAVTGDTIRLASVFTAGSALSVTEIGVFDAVSGGNMDLYGDFAAIDLQSGDSVSFTMNMTVT